MNKLLQEPVFISGKIGQLTAVMVIRNFKEAKVQLRKAGFETLVTPLDLAHQHNGTWEHDIRVEIKSLFDCSSIFMLRNWRHSKSARIMHAIAVETGKNIIYQEHFDFMEFN